MIMREHGSLADFIEHKRLIEYERPELTVDPRLITVDGVDGAGKTTFSRILFERLRQRHDAGGVSLVIVNNFSGGPNQERLERIRKTERFSPQQTDLLYAATVNRSYGEEVVPALDRGNIVVVDRSEIDLVRFAIENGTPTEIDRRLGFVRDGSLTHRRWAGNRILVRTSAEDAWDNLSARKYRSTNDPKSVEDMRRRINAEEAAEERVLELPHHGDVTVVPFRNHRIVDATERETWLTARADGLIDQLRLA